MGLNAPFVVNDVTAVATGRVLDNDIICEYTHKQLAEAEEMGAIAYKE